RFLGTAPGGLASTRPVLEVWLARRGAGGRDAGDTGRVRWLPFDELLAAAGSPALRDPRTLAALALAARSDLLAEWRRPREPGRVFHGARRHTETRGSKRWAGGGGAPCHRDPGAGSARAAGSLFQGRVPPGPRRAWRPDPAVVGRVGGSTGGPAPLLHGGSVSLDHAAGHDPRAWAPLPTHSQLAPLPRHRGARRTGRTNALCLPEGAGDATPLSDACGL